MGILKVFEAGFSPPSLVGFPLSPVLIMAACQRGWAHLLIVTPVLLVQRTASIESWPDCGRDLVGER